MFKFFNIFSPQLLLFFLHQGRLSACPLGIFIIRDEVINMSAEENINSQTLFRSDKNLYDENISTLFGTSSIIRELFTPSREIYMKLFPCRIIVPLPVD